MIFTLIATLTAATVQGFPQLALYQPQYRVQVLPIIKVPARSLRDFEQKLQLQNVVVYEIDGGFQSQPNGEVSQFYQKPGVNEQLKVEPYLEVNSAYVNSEFVNKLIDGVTASAIRNSNTLRRTSVRPRNGFKSKGLPYNPNEQTIETIPKNYDSSNNIKPTLNYEWVTETASRKPVIAPERGYSQFDYQPRIDITPNDYQTPQEINTNSQNQQLNSDINPSMNTQRQQTTIQRDGHIQQNINENENINLDEKVIIQTKDTNFSLKTGTVDAKPVPANGTVDVENVMQSPRPVHLEPGSKSGIDSSGRPEDLSPGCRSDINSAGKPVHLSPASRSDIDSAGRPEHLSPDSRSGIDSDANSENGDRWIWAVTEKVETTTKTTAADIDKVEATTPDIDNRGSFDGDVCPTGKVRLGDKCVDKDD